MTRRPPEKSLAAGASATWPRYAFRLPDGGGAGVGQIQFTVTTDFNDNVSTGQGDPGKTATLVEASTLGHLCRPDRLPRIDDRDAQQPRYRADRVHGHLGRQ